jgi:uncharacterized protein (TIGR02569 family)
MRVRNKPEIAVLKAFNLVGQSLILLPGGTGRTWRAGHAVLKPCDEPVEWLWIAHHMRDVKQDGFRLPLPLQARNGEWVVDGWCAQTALDGAHPAEGGWADVLQAGDRLHQALSHIQRPNFLDRRQHPWALGDRVAWEEKAVTFESLPLRKVIELRQPLTLVSQLIHGDLTENVLFTKGQPPAIIDFSPYWRPVGFASAIVVADAVCWRKADPEKLLSYVADIKYFPQLLIRALIFRMVTTLAFSQGKSDLRGYAPGISLAKRLLG